MTESPDRQDLVPTGETAESPESEKAANAEQASAAATPNEPDMAEAAPAAVEPDAQTDALKPPSTTSKPAAEPEAVGVSQPSGDGEKPKRRRRRRKKKSHKTEAEGAAVKRDVHAPFQRMFEGRPPRRHAFAVGEMIAGRLQSIEDGAVRVDLFGKAVALMDASEPREPAEAPAAARPAAIETTATSTAPSEEGHETGGPSSVDHEEPVPHNLEAAIQEATRVEKAQQDPAAVSATDETATQTPARIAEEANEAHGSPIETSATESLAEGADASEGSISEVSPAAIPDPTEEDLAALLDERELDESTTSFQAGSIVRGRVGAVSESGHIGIVNRLVDADRMRWLLTACRANKREVSGLVFGFNRGGFDVLIQGFRTFCPASGMSLEPIENPEPWIGRKYRFVVAPAKGSEAGIVVTRRPLLEREARRVARALLRELETGQRIEGKVTRVEEYGIFVDLGGFEGLVHQSELSWLRNVRPSDVAKPGDSLEVQVLEVHRGSNPRSARVSLSRRALEPDPWEQHADRLKEGSIQRGRVTRTAEFGAFLQLAPGIEGLLHVSEFGQGLTHANQGVSEGDEVVVVVERVDRKQRRISLSKLGEQEREAFEKGELESIPRPPSLRNGAHVRVLVQKVVHQGVHVQVVGVLGKRGRGFITNRELQGEGTGRKDLAVGTELEAKIVGTQRDGGVRLSIRAREVDEERRAVKDYRREAAKQGLGTFGDLLRAKLDQQAPSGD